MGEIGDRIADACEYHGGESKDHMSSFGLQTEQSAEHQYPVDETRVRHYAELALWRATNYTPLDEEDVVQGSVANVGYHDWYSADPWDAVPPSMYWTSMMDSLVSTERRRCSENDMWDSMADELPEGSTPVMKDSASTEIIEPKYGYGDVAPPPEA